VEPATTTVARLSGRRACVPQSDTRLAGVSRPGSCAEPPRGVDALSVPSHAAFNHVTAAVGVTAWLHGHVDMPAHGLLSPLAHEVSARLAPPSFRLASALLAPRTPVQPHTPVALSTAVVAHPSTTFMVMD